MYAVIESLFDGKVFANPIVRWATALGIVAVSSIVLAGIKHFAARRLESLSRHRPLATLDHAARVVEKTSLLLYVPLGGWLALPLVQISTTTAARAAGPVSGRHFPLTQPDYRRSRGGTFRITRYS